MPAYASAITTPTCQRCGKKATFTVHNTANALLGAFCGRHAGDLVHDLNNPTTDGAEAS